MAAVPAEQDFAPYELSSATLLSLQPPTPKGKLAPMLEWGSIFSHLESRLGMMRTWRYSWWTHWAQLAQYLLPRRYIWLVTANTMNRGNVINQSIIDNTAGLAKNICASGMVNGLMPTTRPWFKLGIGIPGFELQKDAKDWLEMVEKRVYHVLAQSNFYDSIAQLAEDEVVFGTSPIIVYEDAEDVVRFYVPCAGEYYLSVSARLSVDTLYREMRYTVAQLVEMFTLEGCPSQVQEPWRQGGASLELEFVVAHAIEPNFPIMGRGSNTKIEVVKGGFPYREVYWLKGIKTERPLSVRGFREKPFAVARWAKTANDPYGRGPGMDALGDIKQLQLETLRKAEGIEKQVRPPMGADPELKNEPASLQPGHVTYVSTEGSRKGFWPLFEVKPDLTAMTADIEKISERINRSFLVDVFMAISMMEGVQPKQNLEVIERKNEKLQRLGPVIGLWKNELASPVIQRVLNIMNRRRLLPPMPKSLMNVPLKIDYIDMVTLAQLGAETAAMERTFAMMGNLSAASKAAGVADPLRVFNLDQSGREYAERMNFPNSCLYTEDEVKAHDEMREREARMQQMQQAVPAAVDAAKTMSDTDVGGGMNALQAMFGGGNA